MNTNRMLLAAGALVVLLAAHAEGAMRRGETATLSISGNVNSPYVSTAGGTVYLNITMQTSAVRQADRRPLNLSVVLDRSGSMEAEGKMSYAKAALRELIAQLESDDIFSLVIYDDVIDVLRPAGRVGGNKRDLLRLVDGIYPRGATNLGGGMMEGLRQVERNRSRNHVNRVVLLSDGLANRGVTSEHELNGIARRYRNQGISLTTMGVGLEYNENLMVGLSSNGGGNYYFIESAHGLARMMSMELNSLSSVLAQNASIELTLGRGVVVKDVIGCDWRPAGDRYVISVGDVYAKETREFTVELLIPEGTGSLHVAKGELRFEPTGVKVNRVKPFSVRINYTRDVAAIDRHRDMSTQAKVDLTLSARSVEHALNEFDAGRKDEAMKMLEEANSVLMSSPAAQAGVATEDIKEQRERLELYGRMLRDEDSTRAKKSVQYENYKFLRGK
jgi:Ca-activated chloride channel family protein